MKSRVFKLVILALVLIALLTSCKQNTTKEYHSIFDCDYASEIREHMHPEGVGLEEDETELRLYNFPMLDGIAYCVVQYDQSSDVVNRIDCYMEFSTENIMEQSAKVKDAFLSMIHYETGEYGFYPLDDNEEAGEADFLAGNASMEMLIFDDTTSWGIIWFVTGDVASLRLSKSFE